MEAGAAKADVHREACLGRARVKMCKAVLLHMASYGSGGDVVPHHRKLQAGDIHVCH